MTLAFLGLLMAGCLHDPYVVRDTTDFGTSSDSEAVPPGAGQWNGTTLTMHLSDIGPAVVRYVRGVSAGEGYCTSFFRTEGNVSKPSGIGWAFGSFPGVFNSTNSWSHTFTWADGVNAEVGGTGALEQSSRQYPAAAYGQSTTDIGRFYEGDEITYWFAASYPPPEGNAAAGRMNIEVSCPAGLKSLETGWSSMGYLLSDVSMNGTWSTIDVDEMDGLISAQWGATPFVEWTADVPEGPTTFLAAEPVAGRVTLKTPSGEFACETSANGAVSRDPFCQHAYGGGKTAVQVSQVGGASLGGTTGNPDSWMGLIAQMEYYTWVE